MKVVYILSHPIQYQSPLIRALREDGVDIWVIYGPSARQRSLKDPELGRHEPWDIPLLEGYPSEVIDSSFRRGIAGFLYLRGRLQKVVEKIRPDAIWIHGWGDAFTVAAWMVGWQMGIPILLRGEAHLHCLRGGSLRRMLHRAVLSRCFDTVDRFLSIGTANREFYRHYGVSADRIFDMPYAVDNSRFGEPVRSEWRSRLGIGKDDIVLGFSGKLKGSKRPEWVIRGAAEVSRRLASGTLWVVLAGDGPRRRKLEHEARALRFDRVVCLGFQNQSAMPDIYRMMDILVLPSTFEPWGLVVNEAMAAGRPVLVSDNVGSHSDLVTGSPETGAVFKTWSWDDFVNQLQAWVSDTERLERAGIAAANHVRTWGIDSDVVGFRAAMADLPRQACGECVVTGPIPLRRGVVFGYIGVHQIFQMAAAAAEEGRLEHFYCSLIGLPRRWGGLLSRWLYIPSARPLGSESLPSERVTELPLPLVFQRVAERSLKPRHLDPIFSNAWFGSRVAARLHRHTRSAGIVVGAETCALEMFQAAKREGMRCILDCHGIPTFFLQEGINRAAADHGLSAPRLLDSPCMDERKRYERELADVMVLCSELQKKIYLEAGADEGHMRVIPLWVDAPFWQRSSSRGRGYRDGGRMRILFVGAGSLAKGFPYLVQAVKLLDTRSVELTLIGSIEPAMADTLQTLRVPKHRLAYCTRTELRQQYWSHDVLVLPSLGDSFGFVALEAMACGLPVVVTDRCGVPVPHDSWKVPAFSAHAIAGALQCYLDTPALLETAGKQAAAFAQTFTSRRYRESIKSLYQSLVP